jgi:rhodanese-related sulfurtransferase
MTSRHHRVLAIVALVLGAGAALTGRRPGAGTLDVAQLARAVAREEDHVTAVELGEWIKSRRPNLRILDLRTVPEFDSLHIPGAEQVAIDSLDRLRVASDETVVLYSEGGAHSAQAWVFLRALGHSNVFFLKGGVHEWVEDVLSPGLPLDAADAERRRFAKAAELSRYFGGSPRVGVSRQEKAESIAQMRRRGC